MKLSTKQSIGLSMIFSILLASAVLSCDFAQFNSEITEYPVQCEGILKDGNCNEILIPLNRTTYKVSVKRQEVIYWMPGIWEEPRRLVNCVVRDRKNWVGEYSDGSGQVKMVKGKVLDTDNLYKTIYVSKWRWWFITLTGKDFPRYLRWL